MEKIQWGTVMYFLKLSDPEYFKSLNLKTVNQCTEIDKILKGQINNSIVAKVFHEKYNWKYQYSNGLWYRLSDGGIYEQLTTKDSDVLIAKEIKEYLQKILGEVISTTTDDDKMKKLFAAKHMIETHSFFVKLCGHGKTGFHESNFVHRTGHGYKSHWVYERCL